MIETFRQNQNSYNETALVAADFDGTIADTFRKSPGGIGIDEACEEAVGTLFSSNGLRHYRDNGGLRNRAPYEIVTDLVDGRDPTEIDELTREFIDLKLQILLNEIGTTFSDGTIWPQPMPGYKQFRDGLAELSTQTGMPIDELILSSGHKQFIEETLRAWGLDIAEQPFIFGEEMAREYAKSQELPVSELVKPSPKLMTTALNAHRETFGLQPVDTISPSDAQRIVYVGDDPYNDGLLSVNSGLPYILIRPGESARDWQQVGNHLKTLGRAGLVKAQQGAGK